MLPTVEELQQMYEAEITLADREGLADLDSVEIDREKPPEDRIRSYLEQVHNPFLAKAGDYILKFRYADCQEDMEDRLAEDVEKMARIRC